METQDPTIVKIYKTGVVADWENGVPDFPFTGLESRFEPSSEGLVGFSDLRNVNSRSGVGHAGPRQA
jgi:hypothetical protein